MIFLYDKDCGFCTDWIKFMKDFDYACDINFISCQDYNINSEKKLNCKSSSYFILESKLGDKIYGGAAGVNHLLRRISSNRLLKYFGYLYLIPPINYIEDFGYYLVKKNRRRLRNIYKKD